MKGFKLYCLLATGMSALPAVVYAQAADTGTDVAAASEEQAGVGDIVVTAQKRSESLQRTPAAVTAATGETLTQVGVTDLRGAQILVPAARLQAEGSSTQIFVRGVGTSVDLPNTEQTIAFNFNGVYIPREGTSIPFFDIERFEVLPGPQGTLYGRNALGGVVNVTFKRPTQDVSTEGLLELGNYSRVFATLVQNAPLSDALAVRVAGNFAYHDGYLRSGADSQKDYSVRLSALYDKGPAFQAYLWGYYSGKAGRPANTVNRGFDAATFQPKGNVYLTSDPYEDRYPGALAAFAPFGQPGPSSQDYDNWAVGAQLDWKLGDDLSLAYIPSYLYLDFATRYWLTTIPVVIRGTYHQVTQELRLSGTSEKLDWLLGLYGYRQVNSGDLFISPGALVRLSDIRRNRIQGAALFGQGTYKVSDDFRITIGGRFSYDDRKANGIAPTSAPYSYDRNFHRFDYKVAVEFDLAPKSLLYASYQTGYQPGTYNELPATPTFDNAVKPPRLSAATAGIKNRFADNKVQINLEAYYYDYRDLFIQAFDLRTQNQLYFNAQKIRIYGAQLDTVFAPAELTQLSLSVAYTHGRNKRFVTPFGDNYNGLPIAFTPEWTVSGAINQSVMLGEGKITGRIDGRYESSFYSNYFLGAGTRQNGVFRGNASLTYYPEGDRWNIGLWVNNFTDSVAITAAASGGIPGPGFGYLQPPRTYGARLGFSF